MAKPKTLTNKRNADRAAKPATLGPGLHAATIELRSGRTFFVRTAGGLRASALLADDVTSGFAMECLRTSRIVIVTETPRGVVVLGALQTSVGVTRDDDDRVTISGREVRLRADRGVTIEAGPVAIRVDKKGDLRFEGDRLVVDMAALVRFLSARVELP